MAPVFRPVRRDFFRTWSPHMAYVLGYFAADGAMIQNSRGSHFIEFHSTDKVLIVDIRAVLGSMHRIGVRVPAKNKPNHKTAYRLQIGSMEMYNDLLALGMSPRKSLTLRMPTIPREYIRHFVRGYFDGDGCVYFKALQFADRKNQRQVLLSVFSCGTYSFLESLLALLKGSGVKGGSLKQKKSGNELALSHRDSVALYRIMYNNLHDSDIYLGRKYRLFTHAIETLYGNMRE